MTQEHYGAVLARIDEHMTNTDQKLDRVLAQVQATNGRLRTAEQWIFAMRIIGAGLIAVVGWIYVLHIGK